jgi:hypothetical protein
MALHQLNGKPAQCPGAAMDLLQRVAHVISPFKSVRAVD